MIDWSNSETHLLLNPRLAAWDRQRLERLGAAVALEAHVWIATSGSTGALKLVALSKQALLASAAAVNHHLGAGPGDTWYCVLPTFHVGGLGIYARASLTGARVIADTWDPDRFAAVAVSEQVSFASLVPAQVTDLVRAKLEAPPSIRAVIVGGGAMAAAQRASGRALGWPLLQSYGMTECCSQIATATVSSDELQLLEHLEARTVDNGRLAFCGSSLLSGYALFDEQDRPQFIDPKEDGWFISDDLGSITGRTLQISGRRGEFIKIGGESVELGRLDRILAEVVSEIGGDAAVIAASDERLGHVIHLAVTKDGIAEVFDRRVLPFERARRTHRVREIPRSSLGKVLRAQLETDLLR